ncbi:pilus assembly protein TadG-related protein [Pseudomonas sp. S12(2018)]|uniref:pilus assembly protein TadG-related protein n=1 Tax=Pseudomonas sp. S12(2018) TaxID=2219664 RepID=UPI0020CC9D8A
MATRFPTRQRGAIGLMAALTLALALVFALLVIDSGRLYLEQRSLQRVVDMAALEAAGQSAVCTGSGPQAATVAQASAARNGFAPGAKHTLATTCGTLQTGAGSRRTYTVNPSKSEAVRVSASSAVATSIAAGVQALLSGDAVPATTTLHASAVASLPKPPQAMLRLQTTLAVVDSRKSALLNALLDPLGGKATLDAVGWQGIANVDINLLAYIDQLAVNVGVGVGHYDELLAKNLKATDLIKAAIYVAQRGGATTKVIADLGKVLAAANIETDLQLGSILDIQSGTVASGLDASVQLLQLLQAVILLANKQSAAVVDLPLSVLGLLTGSIKLKVVEPPQFSAVGNPVKAKAAPLGSDQIMVKTAQIRAMVSINMGLLSGIGGLVGAISTIASPLTSAVSNLLGLNLKGTITALLCVVGPCEAGDIVPFGSPTIDISLEVAQARSYVTDYSCGASKSLTARTDSAALDLKLGKIVPASNFNSSPTVYPLPLIDIGTRTCSLLLICGPHKEFTGGGVGIKIDTALLKSSNVDLLFSAVNSTTPPDIGKPPAYNTSQATNILQSLTTTVDGIELQVYRPQNGNLLGSLLVVADELLTSVRKLLDPVIENLLSPLLDPILNSLLKGLGIDLNHVEVGANLTCGSNRAQLML